MPKALAALLPSIEVALAEAEHFPLIDARLRTLFDTAQEAGRRPYMSGSRRSLGSTTSKVDPGRDCIDTR